VLVEQVDRLSRLTDSDWRKLRAELDARQTRVVGTSPGFECLYMDPPKHTVVVSIDEKSQIQALDRTQPGLPLKPGKCGTMTHDYKRNGTTTLYGRAPRGPVLPELF
jgi:hypothetical protein